jgi:hypothetical protein
VSRKPVNLQRADQLITVGGRRRAGATSRDYRYGYLGAEADAAPSGGDAGVCPGSTEQDSGTMDFTGTKPASVTEAAGMIRRAEDCLGQSAA